MGEKEKIMHCPVCGCSEHRLVGCGRHWTRHKVGPDGKCEQRHFNS